MGNVTIGAALLPDYRRRHSGAWRWPLFLEMAQRLPLHWHCSIATVALLIKNTFI